MSPSVGPLAESTVLVTDDDRGVRTLISFVLEQAGSTVLQAADGREALAIVEERCSDIDAVLLDVMMPVMSGPEAFPEMREVCPGIPVVFFSGFDRNEVAEQLGDPSGYTAFMPKPCDNDDLVAELGRAISSR
jgi:CheY-like chemotaxis protein